MSESITGLRHRTAYAALLSGVVETGARVMTLLLSVVTARLLGPADVGILGLAVTIMTMVSVVGFFPETAAVVAGRDGTDHRFALAATLLRAVMVGLIVAVLASVLPSLSLILTESVDAALQLQGLLHILLWMPVVEILACYPQVVLHRRLEIPFLARLQFISALLFVGGALGLLSAGYGITGVAWAQLVATAIVVAVAWHRLGREVSTGLTGWPSMKEWRNLLTGTWRLFAGRFLGFIVGRTDNLLVAGAIGATGMSFYSMAWNATRLPLNLLDRVFSFVLVPTLTRIRDDPARVQRAVDESLRYSYLILTPVCVSLLATAPLLTSIVLGPKWLPLVPCLRVMSLTIIAGPLLFLGSALLVGIGRAHLMGLSTMALLVLQVLMIPPLSRRWGPLGAAWADLIAVAVLTAGVQATARLAAKGIAWSPGTALVLPATASVGAGALAWNVPSLGLGAPWTLAIELGVMLIGYPMILVSLGGRDRLRGLLALLRGARHHGAAGVVA